MPRALLLKKLKFTQDDSEDSPDKSTSNTDRKIRECDDESEDDGCNVTVNTRPKNIAAGQQNKDQDLPIRVRRSARRKVGVRALRRIRVKIEDDLERDDASTTCNFKVIETDTKGADVEVTLSEKDSWDLQQVLRDCPNQQHFVKWLKKEGKTTKVWECGICHKEFMHQYTLMRHLPIHTNERNFRCDVCDKAFRQASTLCRHKAIHSDARPFLCTVCSKAFNRSSTLIAHRKTHSEVKPHTCHVCGKAFHQKGNLKNHVFTHTGERPYKCDKCERGFNQMSNLMCHKAHAHVERPKHTCQLCGKEFPRKFSLRSHEEYKHGIKYDITGEQTVIVDHSKCREMVDHHRLVRGRPSNGPTSKTITLPNGDKTIRFMHRPSKPPSSAPVYSKCVEISASEGALQTILNEETQAQNVPEVAPMETGVETVSAPVLNELQSVQAPVVSKTTGILIDPISTPAMLAAQESGQLPFALLRPAKGIPVLVKVLPTTDGKQVLVPATAEDLKSSGKITVSPSLGQANGTTIKAVQIKVPVVATVSQKISPSGRLVIEIEPVDSSCDAMEEIAETQVAATDGDIPTVEEEDQEVVCTTAAGIEGGEMEKVLEDPMGSIMHGMHLSCADALATLSAAAANLGNQSVLEVTAGNCLDGENEIVEIDPTVAPDVIQHVLENITHLNRLTAS